MKNFRLIACREDGTLESQTVDLAWNTIIRWESDEESMSFCFEYSRNDKPPRWVKVYTQYVSGVSFLVGHRFVTQQSVTSLNLNIVFI